MARFCLAACAVLVACVVAAPADQPNNAAEKQQQQQQKNDYPGFTDPNDILYMNTTTGRVVIKMYRDVAPQHIKRISDLVRSGFYDGLIFHRVIKDFVAQGGDPLGKGYGGTGVLIPAEFSDKSHFTGAVNMARVDGDVNSADTQFSIMYRHNKFLDHRYTVWGHVLAGMENVYAIKKGDPKSGKVEEPPDQIVQMRIPGDVEGTDCYDKHEKCVEWAMSGEPGLFFLGECLYNRVWMHENCPLSCGLCPVLDKPEPPCMDLYAKCEEWATPGKVSKEGECVNNKHWMAQNCRKTCNAC